MPHGRLTPLGKQLRCVLANFTTLNAPTPTDYNGIVSATHVTTRPIATTSAVIEADELHDFNPIPAAPEKPSARALRRRTRVDHVGDALRATGKGHLQFGRPAHKPDLTYIGSRTPTGARDATSRRSQHRLNDGSHASAVSLQSILGRHMTVHSNEKPLLSADWQETVTLSAEEIEFLRRKGYAIEDVVAWADITSEEDTCEAAQKLATRNAAKGVLATPLFVYLNLLRRPDIPGRALRILLECARTIFDERAKLLAYPGIDDQPRFLAVLRLLRHARQVWPACMLDIVQLVLQSPQQPDLGGTQLSLKSHQLNKLMSLVSLSTNERAFKNGDYQEAALIPILRYMSEHEPSLHINRQGYRAVIRIQLAQRKTSDEQQWAELKALSWPPWKEDRTGMDALVTKEVHGMSRASQTLTRMREAGYRPLRWEQLAQVHAGWDVDGTPTIQTRVRLDEPRPRLSRYSSEPMAESARWAARITSTRTVQEAWACYLAWEDEHMPSDQDVFLATAVKLREEQRRPHIERRRASQAAQQKVWPLFPGDARELSPLPPSTHLETYTRTRPPTLENFYEELKGRDIQLRGHALAFFIRHARTLPFGLAVLRDSAKRYPGINDILSRVRTPELVRVPLVVYTAAVELFARFGEVPMAEYIPRTIPDDDTGDFIDRNPDLNQRSGIIHAIQLLRLRPETHVHMWNAVHQGLTRGPNISRFANVSLRQCNDQDGIDQRAAGMSEDIRRCGGAFQAYRLSRYVRDLQARNRVELSTSAFCSFCIVTEYRLAATWTVLQAAEANSRTPQMQQSSAMFDKLISTAKSIYRDRSDLDVRMAPHQIFDQLVGVGVKTATSGPDLPRLLTVPSPAVLHVYIRTQGWLSRYQSLVELATWMREYRVELLERRKLDRNGDEMMRRAIIALRVFLERSWLPGTDAGIDYGVMNDGSAVADTRRRLKAFRDPANKDRIKAIKAIVEAVEEWGGWPSDEEVELYAADKRFQPFREYEMRRNQRAEKYVPMAPAS